METSLRSFKRIERFYRRKALASRFLFVVWALLTIAAVIFAARSRNLLAAVNSQTIIVFLTSIYVLTTLYYAHITSRMLTEMREARRAEIRPILWVELDKPEFRTPSRSESDLKQAISTSIKVSNLGRGPAVGTTVKLAVPYRDGARGPEYIHGPPSPKVPVVLKPNSYYDGRFTTNTHSYDVDKLSSDFLEVRIIYEDMERNLYSLIQFYDLFNADPEYGTYLWNMRHESLYFYSFSERDHLGDKDRISLEEWASKPIFRRESF